MDDIRDQIEARIKEVVLSQLAPARVVEVRVTSDVDYDGDPILNIDVVVETDIAQLDPLRVASLPRHLRDPLHAMHEDRFPIFNFLTPDENSGAAA